MPDQSVTILNLGHAGDGVTADGRFIPFAAPGDHLRLTPDGQIETILTPGPSRINPICPHFTICGGCVLQHIAPPDYTAFKRDLVIQALSQRGFTNAVVENVLTVPPQSRRRAALKVVKRNGQTQLGFNRQQSHSIIDLESCHILTPELFALTQKLRPVFHTLLREGEGIELHLTQAENGFDLSLRMARKIDRHFTTQLASVAGLLKLIRITRAQEPVLELERPFLTIGASQVHFPPETFLQPVHQAEHILQSHVLKAVGKAKRIADLFCGIGTFALPLASQAHIHAVDTDAAMIRSLDEAARHTSGLKPIQAEKRDLFRRPLLAPELQVMDAIVLDPPRAGAEAQIRQIAPLKKGRVVYVSCNPASFARDARILVDAGWHMGPVTPVDQFLWSAHIELIAQFNR